MSLSPRNAAQRAACLGAFLGLALPVFSAAASQALVDKAGCSACHAADKKVLGPSWHDVALKYKGRADAPALLAQRVRHGSQGAWGPVPMPATESKKLNDAELKSVVAWVLKSP